MQIKLLMQDVLFITWVVPREVLRKLVPEQLELDARISPEGRDVGLVSAVCFRVPEVTSSVLPLPRLSFEQINYRAYVKADDVPAVYFFDMRVNSRTITTLTSFLKAPVAYEEIDLVSSSGDDGAHRYQIKSAGLSAEASVRDGDSHGTADYQIAPDFITQRLVGYASAGDSLFKLEVDHGVLDALPATIESVQASRLEQLGLLSPGALPHSALYVREAMFGANPPVRAVTF